MIRRKSTVDHAQRQKHTKNVQIFTILDLCLQLPSDDRILIRNQIKNGDQSVMQRIYQCKRDKNYQSLQIYLRKYIQKRKQNNNSKFEIQKNTNRGKTPLTIKSMNNPTQSSYHNSLQSTPSAKKQIKLSITRHDIEKHIQNQINRQIFKEISKEECEISCKDITPRQIYGESKDITPLQSHKKNIQNMNQPVLSMKNILKAKLSQRITNTCHPQTETPQKQIKYSQRFTKQNIQQTQQKQYNVPNRLKTSLLLSNNYNQTNKYKDKNQQIRYGQFYKRIKQVIEQTR